MPTRCISRIEAALILTAVCVASAHAGAILSGTVQDRTKGPIDGAEVTIWHRGGGKEIGTASANGRYAFTGLEPGTYFVRTEKPGMARLYGALRLTSDDRHELNLILLKRAGETESAVRAGSPYETATAPLRLPQSTRKSIKQSRVLRQIAPKYPPGYPGLWRSGMSVAAIIRTNGLLDDIVVLSAPDPEFAQAILQAVLEWRYSPTYIEGKPVEVSTTISLNIHPR